jgi:hypothetical protein
LLSLFYHDDGDTRLFQTYTASHPTAPQYAHSATVRYKITYMLVFLTTDRHNSYCSAMIESGSLRKMNVLKIQLDGESKPSPKLR